MDPLSRLIFFPEKHLAATPADLGLAYEDVDLVNADGEQTHGWFVPGPGKQVLLWFHGNAGNISHRLDNLRLLHDMVGTSILIIDYGGFGRSSGIPSEHRMYSDARLALTFITERGFAPSQTIYFGRSLGSAVAIQLATESAPARLILETPFESIRAMAGTLVPSAMARVIPQRFDNLSKVPGLSCPVLFIHGDRDELVPFAHSETLYRASPEPKEFHRIAGAGHNDTYIIGGSAYFAAIASFIAPENG